MEIADEAAEIAMLSLEAANSIAHRQADAIMTLFLTFQPRTALKPYLVQIKRIVDELEGRSEMPGAVLTSSTTSSSSCSVVDESIQGFQSCVQPAKSIGESHGDAETTATTSVNIHKTSSSQTQSDGFETLVFRKLKPCRSIDSNHSGTSTVTKRSESYYLDAVSVTTSVKDATARNKNTVFHLPPLSPSKRPRNENLSPNKPPTPRKSNPLKIITQLSSSSSMPQPARTRSRSPIGDRYHDSSRFLDGADVELQQSNSDKAKAIIQQIQSNNERTRTIHQVFDTAPILARILEFDGSLAAYYKNYDLIEGYKTPQRRRRNPSRFQKRPGTNQLAFVNQKFFSLVIGTDGLDEWKRFSRFDLDTLKHIARQIMTNCSRSATPGSSGGPSSLAKIFAIVVRNDAIEFEYLLSKHVASIQQGTSINNDNGSDIFGMALKEYVKGGDDLFQAGGKRVDNASSSRSMGLPKGHPFLKHLRCWHAKEFYYTTLLAELAFNAVVCGALDVLSVLSKRHNTLYSTAFGPTGGQNLLGELVAFACAQPCCSEELCQGIRTLMSNQRFDQEELHTNLKGSPGNSLHLAAAKGDRELVDALLDVGCDPTIKCDERAFLSRGNQANKDGIEYETLWYPEDWARVRGHSRVVRMLVRRRKQLLQQRQVLHTAMSDTTAGDTTTLRNDYDTITADYDSNSSSEYDSDQDSDYDSDDSETTGSTFEEGNTFEEKTTFEEGNTFEECDSSDYNSDDESRMYPKDSFSYTQSNEKYRATRRR